MSDGGGALQCREGGGHRWVVPKIHRHYAGDHVSKPASIWVRPIRAQQLGRFWSSPERAV